MKRAHLLLVVSALTFAVSCTGHHGPKVACGPKGAQTTSFDTVLRDVGAGADQSQRLQVVRDERDFGAAWRQLFEPNTPPPLPTIDFQSEMVIIYAMGTQPSGCYTAEITSVRRAGGELAVDVEELEPGPRCVCTLSLVMPFHVIRLPAQPGPVSLCAGRTTQSCKGAFS